MDIHTLKNRLIGLAKSEKWRGRVYEVVSFLTVFVGIFIYMAAANPFIVAFWNDVQNGYWYYPGVDVIGGIKIAAGGALVRSLAIYVAGKFGIDYRKLTEKYKKPEEK